jgi:formylmethanofuran dehydrogenase subunit E
MSNRPKTQCPDVLLVMKQVDGGSAVIGLIECPHCGETHYTTDVRCGERRVRCGVPAFRDGTPNVGPDGYAWVDIIRIV